LLRNSTKTVFLHYKTPIFVSITAFFTCERLRFGEDDRRIRKGFGAENVSRLRRIALNLLKQVKTAKCGIKIKQHKTSWDEKYLQKILEI